MARRARPPPDPVPVELRRQWVPSREPRTHAVDRPATLVSLNVLSDRLLQDHRFLYTHTRRDNLAWNNRRRLLLRDIIDARADVVCLQECEEGAFQRWFEPMLGRRGFVGLHYNRHGDKPDGCAIFYRPERFDLVEHHSIWLGSEALPDDLQRENVALAVVLRDRQMPPSTPPLVLATTHLLYNPRRGDIKLLQYVRLRAAIDEIAAAHETPHQMLCGDFNIVAHSPLYQLITEGSFEYIGSIRALFSGHHTQAELSARQIVRQEDLTAHFRTLGLHGDHVDARAGALALSPLRSAYPVPAYDDPDPPVTTFISPEDARYVDYALLSPSLRITHTRRLLRLSQLIPYGPAPNEHIPSDHVSLQIRFSLL